MTSSNSPEHLEVSIDIAAPPEKVWAIVGDLSRTGEWSSQCKKTIVFGKTTAVGVRSLNVNSEGFPVVWTTSAKVTAYEPQKKLSNRIYENYATWVFELEPTDTGTRLVHRRELPQGTSKLSQALVKNFFGGKEKFDRQIEKGMTKSVTNIKELAE